MEKGLEKLGRVVLLNDDGSETDRLKYLRYLCDLTGVLPNELLKRPSDSKPQGLIAEKITPCLHGKRKTLRKDYYRFVVGRWKDLERQERLKAANKRNKRSAMKQKNWWDSGEPPITIEGSFYSVTPEIIEELNKYIDVTKCSPTILLKESFYEVPAGLSAKEIRFWLSGKVKKVSSKHLEFVRREWEKREESTKINAFSQNIKSLIPEANLHISDVIEITSEIRQALIFQRERTSYRPLKLLNHFKKDVPYGLNAKLIEAWLTVDGNYARREFVEFVLEKWKSLPDSEKIHLHRKDGSPNEILCELRALRHRTGVSSSALLAICKDIPDGLSNEIIKKWLSGRSVKAKRSQINYVLDRWRDLPEVVFVPLRDTDGTPTPVLCELKDLRRRSHIPFSRLFANCEELPEGLSYSMIESWFLGNIMKAKQHYIDFVRERLESSPINRRPKQNKTSE